LLVDLPFMTLLIMINIGYWCTHFMKMSPFCIFYLSFQVSLKLFSWRCPSSIQNVCALWLQWCQFH
jgi:hypothetical protein